MRYSKEEKIRQINERLDHIYGVITGNFPEIIYIENSRKLSIEDEYSWGGGAEYKIKETKFRILLGWEVIYDKVVDNGVAIDIEDSKYKFMPLYFLLDKTKKEKYRMKYTDEVIKNNIKLLFEYLEIKS